MISKDILIGYIQKAMPDAQVEVTDKTGMMDHFRFGSFRKHLKGKPSSIDNGSSIKR